MTLLIDNPPSISDHMKVRRCWGCTPTVCNGLTVLFKMSRVIHLAEQADLFGPSQNSEMAFLVLDGSIGLFMADGRGGETLVRIVGPGDFVGGSLMLTGDAQCFSARTLTPARIAAIPGTELGQSIEENTCFRRLFFTFLSDNLQQSIISFAQLKLLSAPQRLGGYLLSILDRDRGSARLQVPFELRTLAEMLGMRPESLSRAFRDLAKVGVFHRNRGVITVDSIERLAAFCETTLQPSIPSGQSGGDELPSWRKAPIKRHQGIGNGIMPNTPVFSMLSSVDLQSLLSKSQIVDYDQLGLLFEAGMQADRSFVVISGRVRLFVNKGDGRETTINMVEAGQSFAEAAMLGGGRYPVSAETFPGTRLLHIPKESLTSLLFNNTAFAQPLVMIMAQRQKQLFEWIMEFKTRTPTERLVHELLKLTDSESGAATVSLTMSKGAFACHLGVAAESLSRIFARLRPLGVKTSHASNIVISDIAALRNFSGHASRVAEARTVAAKSRPRGEGLQGAQGHAQYLVKAEGKEFLRGSGAT